jgi:hypothetical protein
MKYLVGLAALACFIVSMINRSAELYVIAVILFVVFINLDHSASKIVRYIRSKI